MIGPIYHLTQNAPDLSERGLKRALKQARAVVQAALSLRPPGKYLLSEVAVVGRHAVWSLQQSPVKEFQPRPLNFRTNDLPFVTELHDI